MPAIVPALDSHLRTVACLRASSMAFHIQAAHTRGTVPPDSLAAFDRPLRTDPFTNADFRYRRTEDTVVIYSVGYNGQDDGGEWEKYTRYHRADVKDDFGLRLSLRPPEEPPAPR